MCVYLHNGAMGDIIYALPVLRETPGVLALTKAKQLEFLYPLLALQPYVTGVTLDRYLTGFIDLCKYREISQADLSKHLATCHAEAVGVEVDLETPWLENVTPNPVAKIIVNRTSRYHGKLDWTALWPFIDDILFVGSERENECFPTMLLRHHKINDALELAQVIAGSSLFIGNQSCAFAIAEALKHPRVLEVSTKKPNCMPHGAEGWTELTTGRIEELCSLEPHN